MKIALVNLKSTFLENPMVFGNLGLWYLAARLESLGHYTVYFDLNVDPTPTDIYDQIWVSATSPQMGEIKRFANETAKYKSKRVLGGASVWANPDSCRDLGYDLIVGGETDSPHGIAQVLNSEKDYEFIPVSKTLDWVLPPVRRWARKYSSRLDDREGKAIRASTMFTSRGCPMECAFCIEENQMVLMADWSYKKIKDVVVGEMVMGMHKSGVSSSYLAPTRVLNVIDNGIKETIRINAGGHSITCTPDHKLYVDDGNKTRWKRADSSVVGKTMARLFPFVMNRSDNYKRGWLSGYIAGDGCIHKRNNQTQITIASRDTEMLDIIQKWSIKFGCVFRKFKHKMGGNTFPTKLDSDFIDAVQCTSGAESDSFLNNINTPGDNYYEWCAGWLAGMYDSDGGLDNGDCRIYQSKKAKPHNCEKIERCLDYLDIKYSVNEYHEGMNRYCINSVQFLTTCVPMMNKKYPEKLFYKNFPKYYMNDVVKSFEKRVYDLTTECHSFVVEGFIVHNCESGRHGVIWSNLVRYEPLDSVEYQINELKNMGFGALCYYDDILPLHKKRTIEIMKLHRKYGMIWRCFLRSDIIHKHGGYDYLKEMRDGGLVEVFVGVESADNRIKEGITKKTTIEQDSRIIEWCRKLGIRCKVSLIMGLPGESKESINETLKWVLEYRPDRVQWGRIIPFPGTPLFKNIQNYDLKIEHNIPDDWFYMGHNSDNHSFVSTSNMTVQEIDEEWHRVNKILKDEGIPS